ncbi:MAG: ABC transporter ATP-binding protein [Deltaproteobacteria bacterium]|nr:ABC transporter ATP-binding protein [Deltaproteobacteria bacterium]
MPGILTVKTLSKSFGNLVAVHDLTFDVAPQQILGIIGPNGAGKTTLFNLITGEIRPDRGEVLFNGEDITHCPTFRKCRRGMARTYQIPRPFLAMTVIENLLVGAIYGAGLTYRRAKEKSEETLIKTGLISKRYTAASSLPLLDRKRLELAKALSTDPTLLLIDEVAGGLSEGEVEALLGIIHSVRDKGVAVLWVEHIVMAMQRGPDRLLVMNFGRKMFDGKPEEAFESEDVQKIYLGAEEA